MERKVMFFEVGQRLKKSAKTNPLKLPYRLPFMSLLKEQIEQTAPTKQVFDFSSKTAYNIMFRAGFHYPHLCRLSRITNLFEQGMSVNQVKDWTGLSVSALNFYCGKVTVDRIGDKLT
jgi:hypothetical protein